MRVVLVGETVDQVVAAATHGFADEDKGRQAIGVAVEEVGQALSRNAPRAAADALEDLEHPQAHDFRRVEGGPVPSRINERSVRGSGSASANRRVLGKR